MLAVIGALVAANAMPALIQYIQVDGEARFVTGSTSCVVAVIEGDVGLYVKKSNGDAWSAAPSVSIGGYVIYSVPYGVQVKANGTGTIATTVGCLYPLQ